MSDVDVSVIIPTYNRAHYLGPCVRSILAAAPVRCEVIVADDGSTEDLRPAVAGFGDQVRIVRQANAGPAKARNTGAATARGRYLCFLDSDDEWIGPAARRVFEAAAAVPSAEAIFADTSMGNPDDGYVSFIETYGGQEFRALPYTTEGELRFLQLDPLFRRLSRRNVMFLGSLLVRRDFFERVGGFDASLRGAADWEFFMRLWLSGRVAYMPDVSMSLYFKHAEGMSTDSDHMEKDFIKALAAIAVHPKLPASLQPHILSEWQRHCFELAYEWFARGELAKARQGFFQAAWTPGPMMPNLAYAALSSLPPFAVAAGRTLKQRLAGRRTS